MAAWKCPCDMGTWLPVQGRHHTRHRRRRDRGLDSPWQGPALAACQGAQAALEGPCDDMDEFGAERAVAAALKDLEALKAVSQVDVQLEKLKAEAEAEREEKIQETERKFEEPMGSTCASHVLCR
eukprot:Skav219056  [mRNA]  locus=scaffold1033:41154:43121:+ [translate_table: standard]